ncbi:MAG: Ig-like domain-containing protein, partial [Cellvibrio sp.]|uniref:tandem-95 repeat protein n=1 Tax=Cellvibrio sp. TaxID=1965322 RepID=UPI00272835DB|nr:Ig-like domain-containing protein [Cellvibrio sp.]
DAENDPLTAILVTGPTNGTLTLNADGTFSYVHNGSETTTDSFTYKVNDGTVDGNTVTVNITVAPQNNAPVAVTESITVAEGGTATVLVGGATSVLSNDTDAENDPLTAILVTGPTNGTLTLNADGTFSYVHNGSETTTDSFTYKVNDGTEDGNTVTVNINVTPVNNAPVAVTESITVAEGGTATVLVGGATSVLTNDTDAENDPLTAILVTGPTNGSLTLNADGTFSYVHNGSETTTDSFSYKVNDGTVDGNTVTVNINVTPVNDAPLAVDDSASVDQDEILTLTAAQLLANDTDPDLDALTIDSVQGAVNGSVSIVGGDVVFTPTPGYHGPASFTYTITDGNSTSTATVSINVEKANTAPVANDDEAASTSAGNVGLVSEYFGYQEPTDGANLSSIQQVYAFINGRAPDATFIAKTFDYSAATFSNGLGTGTNLQTFLGSDAASLSADPVTTTDAIIRMRGFVDLGAGTYNFKILADDGYQIRVDGVVVGEMNLNQSATTTTHGQFTLSTGGLHNIEVVYWDQGGYAKLKLELSDDSGVTYDILSSAPGYQQTVFSAVEDTALSLAVASLLANDTDLDGDTLTIQSVQGAVNGTVSLVAGSVIFTPAPNYSGPASFTYTLSDGKGGTDTATVNLAVAPVNDAPIAVADSGVVATNGSVNIPIATLLSNDSDVEGEVISLVSVQGAVNGTVNVSGSNVVFIPTANYEGPASFTYTIRDPVGNTSNGSVTVNVGAASAPSVAVLKSVVALAHGTGGTSIKFPIATSLVDTDGSETLSIKVSGVPTGVSFNSGTNLGGGVWQFTSADLPNLMLNLPGSYTTTNTSLTVQVTSTEVSGGFTATTSSTLALRADYTTVDIATTESGNYTGNSANEYIQGGTGNNTISAGNGNNVVYGGDGNDTITAGGGYDVIFGGSGNDTINSGVGSDRISGGAGNDTMSGAGDNFVDVFVWSLGDQGAAGSPAEDTINNFSTNAPSSNTNGGDVLDLRDLLQGEHVGASNSAGNLADYLHFEIAGADTIIHISHTGGFSGDSHTLGAGYTGSAETQKITLTGVDLQSFYSGATTDQQIITQLLNNNKLITD